MSLDSYSKEQHFHEIARRDGLNTSVNFPAGLATLIAGGLAFVSKTIRFPLDATGLVQFNLVAASSLLLVIACFLLVRAYWNYGYGHMPTAVQLGTYFSGLTAHYESLGNSPQDAVAKAENETSSYITSEYARNSATNSACNDKKSSYLFKANGFIIASIIPLVFAAPLHFYRESLSASDPIKVEIVQPKEMHMANQDKPSTPPPPTQQTQPLPKPEPPPSRIIKEHVDPTKK